MEIKAYDRLFELEETHWGHVSNRKMIFSFMDKYYYGNSSQRKILDAGCGTGIVLKKMQDYGNAFGIEMSDYVLNFCKKKGLKNISKASVEKIPFKSEVFDIIGCFGVLYHKNVQDDVLVLKEFYRVCKRGGRVFITSPSWMNLPLSKHDKLEHTSRRYKAAELKSKLESVGFKIEKLSYYHFFIFPVVFLKRLIEVKFNLDAQDVKKENFIVNSMLKAIMSLEISLMRYFDLPIGVSLFCIARKPLN